MINDSNISNYLRRFEQGLLTDEELDQFTLFLESKLNIDESAQDPITELSVDFKERLKKSNTLKPTIFNDIDGEDDDLLMIASVEGITNEKEEEFLKLKVSTDDHFATSLKNYQLTKLKNERIAFPNKSRLKHKVKPSYVRYAYYAAAAAILVGFILNFYQIEKKYDLSSLQTPQLAKIKSNQKNRLTPESRTIISKPNQAFEKTIYRAAPRKVDTTFYMKEEIETIANLTKDSTGLEITQYEKPTFIQQSKPSISTFQNEEVERAETISWQQFLRGKFEKLVFGKMGSSYEDRLAFISSKFQSRTGIPFQVKFTKNRTEKRKLSKFVFGKFSFERN
ncbi:MAG: hypothetical protein ACKO5W_02575 [Crocinitomicaceae bacterium]